MDAARGQFGCPIRILRPPAGARYITEANRSCPKQRVAPVPPRSGSAVKELGHGSPAARRAGLRVPQPGYAVSDGAVGAPVGC